MKQLVPELVFDRVCDTGIVKRPDFGYIEIILQLFQLLFRHFIPVFIHCPDDLLFHEGVNMCRLDIGYVQCRDQDQLPAEKYQQNTGKTEEYLFSKIFKAE